MRRLVRETLLTVDDLVQPLFVMPGKKVRREIASMPGQYHLSVDELVREAARLQDLGVPGIILFGIPESKDEVGSGAYHDNGIVQQAVRAVKDAVPDLLIITDVCLCEYTSHGHCGVLADAKKLPPGFRGGIKGGAHNSSKSGTHPAIDNDATLDLLARTAVSHARAGADIVAPSDMMDGRVGAIRHTLDAEGFTDIAILAYSAKYASAYYGPFREAAGSTPQFGDRRGYQMDPANSDEALREVALDIEEGADIVMVKPGVAYLDVLARVKREFGMPTAAYQVSGEYAMIEAASRNGWLDRKAVVMETLTGFKRAGADFILTYYAGDVAEWLNPEH